MKWILCPLFFLCFNGGYAQTIEEKMSEVKAHGNEGSSFSRLGLVNEDLKKMRRELALCYTKVASADPGTHEALLKEINGLKQAIGALEEDWKRSSIDEAKKEDEGYALWDQEETLLSQLVMEYGSSDYLYIIPPEISAMKIHMHSSIPIPRESWSDLLEAILTHNGVGYKQINPYCRQLYLLKQDLIGAQDIVADIDHLKALPNHTRVIFIFSPDPDKSKGVAQFFDRFRDPKGSTIYQVGSKITIVAPKEEVMKLLKLYDSVWEEGDEKVSRVFSLTKISPLEMQKILVAFFGDGKKRMSIARGQEEDLTFLPLTQEGSIVVVGIKDLVEKASNIILTTEEQIRDPTEMVVYWYTLRHSDPIEVCDALEKVYLSLTNAKIDAVESGEPRTEVKVENNPQTFGIPGQPIVVNPPVIQPGTVKSQKQVSKTQNFVPYSKTGSVMMVVRKDTLPKLKELIRIIDVPKKMVRIEVLLFEKKITNQNNFGLNVLKMGSAADKVSQAGAIYDEPFTKGIFKFFISRPSLKHFPAFDLSYNFLMTQEDVRINASPSILTLNQTPGQTSIQEEISLNNGAAPLDTSGGGITFEKSFTRAQFGINIVVTPTIHEADEEGNRFVSLETDITFDNMKKSEHLDRPDVDRRHISNHVRILDGHTVILGGLQRKTGEDHSEKIPFFGELPGIGKFFSTTRMHDQMTEMFIFITPHVILEEEDDLRRFDEEELMRRPGDLPEFVARIFEAKARHKRRLFTNSLKLLFGSSHD
ncbi:MAG: type II secretion system protein GspD [Simkaniaceae bacterium]|nr:type II secretion system protein GspD [Simkaniaceae bacterium]